MKPTIFRFSILLTVGLIAPAMLADFHFVNIVEVYPGNASAPNAQFIELQAYSSGQNNMSNHPIVIYNAAGGEIGRVSFPPGPPFPLFPHGYTQVRFLIATADAQTHFGITANLILPNNLIFSPAGGKICFDPNSIFGGVVDCVAWGNYDLAPPGGANDPVVGNPFSPAGLTLGQSMQRDLKGNTTLDFGDDTNDSAADFDPAAPTPRNNAFTYRTALALTSSQNPSTSGQSVTFTATATSISGGTPTGNVTFKDGATPLGTVALASGQAQLNTSGLSAGSHSITAELAASAAAPAANPTSPGFEASVSAPVNQQVVFAQLVRAWVASNGLDTNPCTRTEPCRNFSAANNIVLPGGEIVVVDSAGYGAATFTKAVTVLAPPGIHAAIAPTSGVGLTIDAGFSDVVVLRGLYLNSQGASSGIQYDNGLALYVENCVVAGFTDRGIDVRNALGAAGAGNLYVSDSIIRKNTNEGVRIVPVGSGALGVVDRTRLEDNGIGVNVSSASAQIINSVLASNGTGARTFFGKNTLENCAVLDNSIGIEANSGSEVLVSRTLVSMNITGILGFGTARVFESTISGNQFALTDGGIGAIVSFGNNRLAGNNGDEAFTSTIPQQ